MQFCEVIKSYPLQPQPDIFGLAVNAAITCQQAETYELLATVLGLQPRSSSSSSAADRQEAGVARAAKGILEKVRSPAHDHMNIAVCMGSVAGSVCKY
jgi:dynein heavy chain